MPLADNDVTRMTRLQLAERIEQMEATDRRNSTVGPPRDRIRPMEDRRRREKIAAYKAELDRRAQADAAQAAADADDSQAAAAQRDREIRQLDALRAHYAALDGAPELPDVAPAPIAETPTPDARPLHYLADPNTYDPAQAAAAAAMLATARIRPTRGEQLAADIAGAPEIAAGECRRCGVVRKLTAAGMPPHNAIGAVRCPASPSEFKPLPHARRILCDVCTGLGTLNEWRGAERAPHVIRCAHCHATGELITTEEPDTMNRYNEYATAPLSATEQQARDEAHDARARVAERAEREADYNAGERADAAQAQADARQVPDFHHRPATPTPVIPPPPSPRLAVPCPQCHAAIGDSCLNYKGQRCHPHGARKLPAQADADARQAKHAAQEATAARRNTVQAIREATTHELTVADHLDAAQARADARDQQRTPPAPTPVKDDGLSALDRAVEALVREHTSGAVIDAAWAAARRTFRPVNR
jgi:hypothetical protein